MTAYQRGSRTHVLRHIALWDGQEIKVTGSYTGLFPKLPGGHDIQGTFLESFASVNIFSKVGLFTRCAIRQYIVRQSRGIVFIVYLRRYEC